MSSHGREYGQMEVTHVSHLVSVEIHQVEKQCFHLSEQVPICHMVCAEGPEVGLTDLPHCQEILPTFSQQH